MLSDFYIVDSRFRGNDMDGRGLIYGRNTSMFSRLQLQVPGEFNRYNATAAAVAAMELGVSRDVVEKVVSAFKGIWRRF